MIESHGLTKRFGQKTAVDSATFTARPGVVTGFLGPNGAGKSTTMRMVMGLDRPTAGTVTVNGKPYAQHRWPLHEVGGLLEAKAVHPGRTARQHLQALAASHGIPRRRVEDVLEQTGLTSVAGRRVKGFSLGMGQRLGIATALLGDPSTVILDEPVNGLDPEGVQWVRNLARYLAREGRTVFLSSHLMSEVEETADHVVVIGRGRILADEPLQGLVERFSRKVVRVRSPQADELASLLRRGDAQVATTGDPELLKVTGADAAEIGAAAAATAGRVVLHELTPISSTLEEAFMELTADAVEYRTDTRDPGDGARPPGGPPATVGPEHARTTLEGANA